MLSFVPLVPPANPETVSRRESILPQFYPTSFRTVILTRVRCVLDRVKSYKHSSARQIQKSNASGKALKLKSIRKIGTTS